MIPFARTYLEVDEVRSTNDLGRNLAMAGEFPLPMVIRAHRQTAGRGRGANRWYSDAGSLLVTIVLDPTTSRLRRDHEPRVALTVALAVIDAAEERFDLKDRLGIRWPNDVELGSRKVAGLLTERVETSEGGRLIVGIGVNVGSKLDDAPAEVRRIAGSLAELAGQTVAEQDLDRLLQNILSRLPGRMSELAADAPSLAEDWSRRDLLCDQPVQLLLGGEVIQGVGAGIDPSGALRIADDEGVRSYVAGQVLRVQ